MSDIIDKITIKILDNLQIFPRAPLHQGRYATYKLPARIVQKRVPTTTKRQDHRVCQRPPIRTDRRAVGRGGALLAQSTE